MYIRELCVLALNQLGSLLLRSCIYVDCRTFRSTKGTKVYYGERHPFAVIDSLSETIP